MRPWGNLLVRPLPNPHLHDWRNMEVCLMNFNKAMMMRAVTEGCSESTVRYDSISVKVEYQCYIYYTPWSEVNWRS